jgi:hypothetical protein
LARFWIAFLMAIPDPRVKSLRSSKRGVRSGRPSTDQTTLCLPHFFLTKQHRELFGTFRQFLADADAGNLPYYSFVERDDSDDSDDSGGEGKKLESNQLPSATLSADEWDEFLIARIYDAIRKNEALVA